jgi:hypothetical protein
MSGHVDLWHDPDLVLVGEIHQLLDVLAGIVVWGGDVGVPLALEPESEIVGQVQVEIGIFQVRQLADQVLQPVDTHELAADVHHDAALRRRRPVGGRALRDLVVLRDELENGPGAVEQSARFARGDDDVVSDGERVALRVVHRVLSSELKGDVPCRRWSGHNEDRGSGQRLQVIRKPSAVRARCIRPHDDPRARPEGVRPASPGPVAKRRDGHRLRIGPLDDF